MLTIEKTVTPSPEQWDIIIEGMRNPMNSWDKSDSYENYYEYPWETEDYHIGEADLGLMKKLAEGGSVHAKYRRMIPVFVTLTAPLYWWKEYDTYKVGTVTNSCSTMHKIHSKEFTLKDFSHEHLDLAALDILKTVIFALNDGRDCYNRCNTDAKKDWWWQMIQLLPTSYNQKRTIMLNYEVLANIYHSRKDHKLDEWHTFCDWIETLPYSEIITGATDENFCAD